LSSVSDVTFAQSPLSSNASFDGAKMRLDSLFRPLLLSSVRIAQMAPGLADPTVLALEEQRQIENAVATRRREYAAGRLLAHSLFAAFGVDAMPLLNGPDRVPIWPAGMVGSISHCPTLCVVVVADASAIQGLGIDVEPAIALPGEVAARVLSPTELQGIARLPPSLRAIADRLIFSAKEATYKALYPITRQFLDFPDMHVELGDSGEFVATLANDQLPVPTRITGRYRVDVAHLITAVALPN
jgi:4'-phosphopantetheinyl transferase EntD